MATWLFSGPLWAGQDPSFPGCISHLCSQYYFNNWSVQCPIVGHYLMTSLSFISGTALGSLIRVFMSGRPHVATGQDVRYIFAPVPVVLVTSQASPMTKYHPGFILPGLSQILIFEPTLFVVSCNLSALTQPVSVALCTVAPFQVFRKIPLFPAVPYVCMRCPSNFQFFTRSGMAWPALDFHR